MLKTLDCVQPAVGGFLAGTWTPTNLDANGPELGPPTGRSQAAPAAAPTRAAATRAPWARYKRRVCDAITRAPLPRAQAQYRQLGRERHARSPGDAGAGAMAPAMQSAELQFAQRLASSEKGVRDRAVRKLRQYLSARTQSDTGAGRGSASLCSLRGSRLWVRVRLLRAVRRSSGFQLSSPRRIFVSGFVPWPVPAGAGVRERVEAAFQPRRNSGSVVSGPVAVERV